MRQHLKAAVSPHQTAAATTVTDAHLGPASPPLCQRLHRRRARPAYRHALRLAAPDPLGGRALRPARRKAGRAGCQTGTRRATTTLFVIEAETIYWVCSDLLDRYTQSAHQDRPSSQHEDLLAESYPLFLRALFRCDAKRRRPTTGRSFPLLSAPETNPQLLGAAEERPRAVMHPRPDGTQCLREPSAQLLAGPPQTRPSPRHAAPEPLRHLPFRHRRRQVEGPADPTGDFFFPVGQRTRTLGPRASGGHADELCCDALREYAAGP